MKSKQEALYAVEFVMENGRSWLNGNDKENVFTTKVDALENMDKHINAKVDSVPYTYRVVKFVRGKTVAKMTVNE